MESKKGKKEEKRKGRDRKAGEGCEIRGPERSNHYSRGLTILPSQAARGW